MKSLDDIIRGRVDELAERAAKERKKNPPSPPVRNPKEQDLERMIEPSCGSGSNYFSRSVIIGGKHYVVTWGGWRGNISEFGLTELLPPYLAGKQHSLRSDGGWWHPVVYRVGTTERYALGKTLVWRKGKLHQKSAML